MHWILPHCLHFLILRILCRGSLILVLPVLYVSGRVCSLILVLPVSYVSVRVCSLILVLPVSILWHWHTTQEALGSVSILHTLTLTYDTGSARINEHTLKFFKPWLAHQGYKSHKST
jgi:hypothetical protein